MQAPKELTETSNNFLNSTIMEGDQLQLTEQHASEGMQSSSTARNGYLDATFDQQMGK